MSWKLARQRPKLVRASRALLETDEWGPFRMAYLEAVLRAADRRASEEESKEARTCRC